MNHLYFEFEYDPPSDTFTDVLHNVFVLPDMPRHRLTADYFLHKATYRHSNRTGKAILDYYKERYNWNSDHYCYHMYAECRNHCTLRAVTNNKEKRWVSRAESWYSGVKNNHEIIETALVSVLSHLNNVTIDKVITDQDGMWFEIAGTLVNYKDLKHE